MDQKMSGIRGYIPTYPRLVLGGCPANAAASKRFPPACWWTCNGCVRVTDITTCPDKLTWGSPTMTALPIYTPNLLQYFDQHDLHTTFFFVIGSRAISYPSLLQTEYMNQHPNCVHTWSHPYLTTLSNEEIISRARMDQENYQGITWRYTQHDASSLWRY